MAHLSFALAYLSSFISKRAGGAYSRDIWQGSRRLTSPVPGSRSLPLPPAFPQKPFTNLKVPGVSGYGGKVLLVVTSAGGAVLLRGGSGMYGIYGPRKPRPQAYVSRTMKISKRTEIYTIH